MASFSQVFELSSYLGSETFSYLEFKNFSSRPTYSSQRVFLVVSSPKADSPVFFLPGLFCPSFWVVPLVELSFSPLALL